MSLIPPNLDIDNLSRDEILYLLPDFDFGGGQLLAPRVSTKNLKNILYDRENTQRIAQMQPSLKGNQEAYLNQVINKYLKRKDILNKIFFIATNGEGSITPEENAQLQAEMNEQGFDPMFEAMGIEFGKDTLKTAVGKAFLYAYRVAGYDALTMKSNAFIQEYENQKNYLNNGITLVKVLPPNFIENLNKYKEGLTPSIWSLYPEQSKKHLRKKSIQKIGTASLLASIATIFLSR